MGETLDMDGYVMAGRGDALSFEDMKPEERAILQALQAAYNAGQNVLRIAEIMSVNGWDEVEEHECPEGRCSVCATALRLGNSKVRNNLRRLMRFGLIHRPLDGTYALRVDALKAEPRQTAPQAEAVPKLVQIRRNPRELNDKEARILRGVESGSLSARMVESVKRTDCTIYNACLSQAISGKWAGFSCADCTAYEAPSQFQKECNMLALRALGTAAEMLDENGKVNRIRGVKPGADAKRTVVSG
jgi:ferredoxin